MTFSFAGSSDLVDPAEQGAPADVFASADTNNMTKAVTAKLVAGSPTDFATNTLEIAVPPDNPAKVTSFADLSKPGVKLVVCAAQVPCGAAAAKIETATNTTLKPVSEENAVTDVLGKVESGEADAGLVYVTDVKGAGDKVKGIPFDESKEAVNTYPIAALTASKNADLAGQFVQLVDRHRGPAGAGRRGVRQAVTRGRSRARSPELVAHLETRSGVPRWIFVPAGLGRGLRRAPARRSRHPGRLGAVRCPDHDRRSRSTRSASACGRPPRRPWSASSSACRWPWCWRGRRSPASASCGR